MASYTTNLNLLKKDPVADASDTFNIQTMMNDNWDKIDATALKAQAAKITPVDADALPVVDSADSSETKLISWSNIKAALKTFFDNLYAAATHEHDASAITSGTLGVSRGGTGVTTAAAERNRLGLGNTTDALPVANGGTGAATADAARANLSAALKPTIITVIFSAASWVLNGTTGCYEQTVAVAGLLATDGYNIGVAPVGSTDAVAQALTDAAFAVMAGPGGRMSCDTDGQLYARCPAGAAAPTTNFQVAVVISR